MKIRLARTISRIVWPFPVGADRRAARENGARSGPSGGRALPRMRPQLILILAILLLLFAATLAHAQGFFTVVDDDAASIDAISSIEAVARARGVKICVGVVAARVVKDQQLQEKLLEYQASGHQICNHSLTHGIGVWTDCDPDAMEKEIEESRAILERLGFRQTDYFIYPFGCFSEDQFARIFPVVSRHHKLALNSRGRYNLPGANAYYLDRLALRKMNDLSMVKRVIDAAWKDNGWIVFLTHSGIPRDFDPAYVGQVMDYCLSMGMKSCTLEEYYRLHGDAFVASAVIDEYSAWDEGKDVLYLNLCKQGWGVLGLALVVVSVMLIKRRRGVRPR